MVLKRLRGKIGQIADTVALKLRARKPGFMDLYHDPAAQAIRETLITNRHKLDELTIYASRTAVKSKRLEIFENEVPQAQEHITQIEKTLTSFLKTPGGKKYLLRNEPVELAVRRIADTDNTVREVRARIAEHQQKQQ